MADASSSNSPGNPRAAAAPRPAPKPAQGQPAPSKKSPAPAQRIQKPGARPDAQSSRPAGFRFTWCLAAIGIQIMLTAAVLVGLPMVLPILDFEGSNGLMIAVLVWFSGGVLTGMIAPAKTYIEPAVATFLVQLPSVLLLWRGQTVRTMPLFMYILLGLVSVLFAMVGAYLGERIQLGPPARHAD